MMMNEQWPMKFRSGVDFFNYVATHSEVCNSLSPGGAAAQLGVTRQQIYNLVQAGTVRAWLVYDHAIGPCLDVPGNRASYVFVSADDIEAYRVSPKIKGRPRDAKRFPVWGGNCEPVGKKAA
jgi:hypothetical protein